MKPRKKGKQWEISYRCPGRSNPIYERFPSYEAANLRIAELISVSLKSKSSS